MERYEDFEQDEKGIARMADAPTAPGSLTRDDMKGLRKEREERHA